MSGEQPVDHFDEPVAATYDEDSAAMFAPDVLGPTVDRLADLAGPGGSAIELAVGTGRVALPLAARGVRVLGVDLSEPMLHRLRAKPGAAALEVVQGDMASVRVAEGLDLAYLVFNTILNVTSQDGQVRVFETAAAHLRPGGRFVVEVGVPGLQQVPHGQRFHVFTSTGSHLGVDEYDVVTQQMWSHHHVRRGGRWERTSVPFRYAWPAELDLMARIAGMRLVERWADWDRSPFTATSPSHVSVWRRAEA